MIETIVTGFFVIIILAIGFFVGYIIARSKTNHEWEDKVPDIRESAIKQSRSVLTGQFSEQLAPYLPDFPFSPSEARFVGKPIDFIVFKGLDNKSPEEIVFVEVKSGKSRMNDVEKKLKDVIEQKKVSWNEYRIPEGVTKKKEAKT
ncbi:hypothetical protein HY484_00320 [Candidatus Woesearchaeota archaeon]|nr:hypothetical protein [Candidatus Woesearchaeota archaeon]